MKRENDDGLDGAACSASWVSVNSPPTQAGQYIVGNTSHGYTGQARWMPRKAEWKFPAAQSAFTPDVWTVFPSLPNAKHIHPEITPQDNE